MNTDPFDTIESALEFLGMFDAAVALALEDVRRDLQGSQEGDRRADALMLAVYKLEKLEHHISRSRRMANDLRTLRRLLFEERESQRAAQAAVAAAR